MPPLNLDPHSQQKHMPQSDEIEGQVEARRDVAFLLELDPSASDILGSLELIGNTYGYDVQFVRSEANRTIQVKITKTRVSPVHTVFPRSPNANFIGLQNP